MERSGHAAISCLLATIWRADPRAALTTTPAVIGANLLNISIALCWPFSLPHRGIDSAAPRWVTTPDPPPHPRLSPLILRNARRIKRLACLAGFLRDLHNKRSWIKMKGQLNPYLLAHVLHLPKVYYRLPRPASPQRHNLKSEGKTKTG